MRALGISIIIFFAVACRDAPAPRGLDGGAFQLPDAGFRDASVRDAGDHDAGPFVCDPSCAAELACGCVSGACGCLQPGGHGSACDPQAPATCAEPTACVPVRRAGSDAFLCTDGREGSACSKTDDRCTTRLGCVCLTNASAITDCRCTETWDPAERLCDRMVPETCPGGTCVRTVGSGGRAYFLCSDGSRGQPCEANDNSCRTSLGCTCPVIAGAPRCSCSEPGAEGEPCDFRVAGSCQAPLVCGVERDLAGGNRTVCQREGGPGPMPGGCDPTDPESCPPGEICVWGPGGGACIPDR